MRPFHQNDGYVEVTAVGTGAMVELYITGPGKSNIFHMHMTSRTACRLGLWLIFRWIFHDLFGIRSWLEIRSQRKLLLNSAKENI